jgi:general secretion pathway protein H
MLFESKPVGTKLLAHPLETNRWSRARGERRGRIDPVIMMKTRQAKIGRIEVLEGGSDHPGAPFVLRPGPARGFTLLELLVVMIIVSVVLAITIPMFGSNWKRMQDGDFLQQFTQALQRSRTYAMNSGEPVTFRLNGTSRVYGASDPPQNPIPLNVEIRANALEQDPDTGDFIITFYPDGSIVGDDVELIFDNVRIYEVHINALFGTVKVDRPVNR